MLLPDALRNRVAARALVIRQPLPSRVPCCVPSRDALWAVRWLEDYYDLQRSLRAFAEECGNVARRLQEAGILVGPSFNAEEYGLAPRAVVLLRQRRFVAQLREFVEGARYPWHIKPAASGGQIKLWRGVTGPRDRRWRREESGYRRRSHV